MKIGLGLSLTGMQRRRDTPFTPAALFAAGEQGVFFDIAPEYLFQDDAGTIPITDPGQTVGFITDRSGNGNHATQPTVEARPEYREDGPNPILRFDGVDDVVSTNFADGFTGDVIIFGSSGSWIERDVTIAPAGSLNIGPLSFTGAAAGVLPVLGDIVGWIAVDRTLTNAEIAQLVQYYMAQGAKGLLVPGPELNRDPDFNDASKWAAPGGWSVSSGTASISNAEGQFNLRDNSAPVVPGSAHLATVDISSISGGVLSVFENGTASSINFPAATGTNTAIIRLAEGGNIVAVRPSAGTTVILNSFSLRELRPEEDW